MIKKQVMAQVMERIGRRIYVISPYSRALPSQKKEIEVYIKKVSGSNHVHSYMSVNQNDATGYNIVNSCLLGMVKSDEVHIFWDKNSWGCHVDLGMALALEKPLKLIKSFSIDVKEKSYLKVIKEIEQHGYSAVGKEIDAMIESVTLFTPVKKEEKKETKKEEKRKDEKKPTKKKSPSYNRIF